MNFDLEIPQRSQFQEALGDAYRSVDALRMLVTEALDERLEIIVPTNDNVTVIIHDLVDWVNTQGSDYREQLVIRAYVGNPGNEKMQTYMDSIGFDRAYLAAQGFASDVFLSYAEDAPSEFVNKLVRGLRGRITRKLRAPVRLLASPAGSEAASKSALAVVILTSDYADSTRCARERAAFGQGEELTNKTFLVRRSPGATLPPELERARSYPFYQDADYFSQLETLAVDLSEALKVCLQAPARRAPTPAPPPETTYSPVTPRQNAVYLAEATDDLYREWSEVRTYLKQAGLTVLPEVLNSRSPENFTEEMDIDLQQCALYVQLLGPASDRNRQLRLGYAGLQHERALCSKKPMLLWRRPDLNLADITDELYRPLVDSPQVRAEGLESFKQAIVETFHRMQSKPKTVRPPGAGTLPWVFVNYLKDDRPLAEQVVRARLAERGFPLSWPQFGEDDQNYVKNEVKGCDVLLLVYGDVPASWVVEQLRCSRKYRAECGEPLKAKAVYDGPPQSKPDLSASEPGLKPLLCRMNTASLDAFLDELEQQFGDVGE